MDDGWTLWPAAERFQCSSATAARWATRYRAGEPLTDRSSRPHRSPSRLSRRTERRIVALRVTRRWGPHRIGYHLGLPRVTVGRVLGRYRSRAFARALGKKVKHRRTRPYRPQTNGKVERFKRTLLSEWAYAVAYTSDEARAATYGAWLHHYNHHRPRTGIDGAVPADRVHNLTGKYI